MTVDLADYSRTAAAKGWGRGWPVCDNADDLVVVTARRSGTRVSVHRAVAVMTQLLLDWTEHPAGGDYLLKPGQCGGFNCRAISGTRTASNHSWGLALDLNWNDNPYTTSGKRTIPTAVARRWNRYGWAWGGDYAGAKKDWMHFEQMGEPADVEALTALALRELGGVLLPATPTPTPAPAPAPTRREPVRMRSVNLDNPAGATPDRSAVLTVDGIGTSRVMPPGSAAWFQMQPFLPRNPDGRVRVQWLVFRRVTGDALAVPPFDLAHRELFVRELPRDTTAVELVVHGLPPMGAVGAHIDGIGHG